MCFLHRLQLFATTSKVTEKTLKIAKRKPCLSTLYNTIHTKLIIHLHVAIYSEEQELILKLVFLNFKYTYGGGYTKKRAEWQHMYFSTSRFPGNSKTNLKHAFTSFFLA